MGGGWSSWEEFEGGGRRLEEENVEGRRKSQGINIKVKGPSPRSRVGGRDRRR